MRYRSPSKSKISFAALSILWIAGCAPEKKEEAAVETAAAPQVVHITGNDQMQYSVTAFEVQSGALVTVILENVGSMPKEAMGHDFVLLQSGSSVADFAQKAMTAKDNGYIPADAPEMLEHTRLLGPGESDTLTFTAPPAGSYPYLCTFPGHFGVMQGVMTSK
jgi:azurin